MIISKENEEMRYEQSREYNEKLVQYRCKKCGKMFSKLKLSALNWY
jgi:transposase-like protein